MAIRIKVETAYAYMFLASSIFLIVQSCLFLISHFQLVEDSRFSSVGNDDLIVSVFMIILSLYSAFEITQKKLWSYTLNIFIKGIITISIILGILWLLDNFA